MFIELIATIFAGVAAAGVVLMLNKGLGGRLPKWFTPVAAGAAMIAATISNEYSWYPRTTASLPDGIEIAETVESRAVYRPWTFIRPFTERFVAIDTLSIRTNPAVPEHRIVDVYYFGRWSPVNKIAVLADCANTQRAALTDGITFEDDGTVTGAEWIPVANDDSVLLAICEV